MSFELDKANQTVPEPTLAEMTEKAIKTLRMHDNNKGYFLLVEGMSSSIYQDTSIYKK